jgi:hypothetical protein
MLIVPITLGGRNGVFPFDGLLSAEFAFPRSVQRVDAVLSGFRLEFIDSDHEMSEVKMRATATFDPNRSATTGTVAVHFTWRDDTVSPTAPDTIRAEVHVLVIGHED